MDVFDVLADVEANGLTPGEHNDRPRTLKEKAQDGDRPMTAREIVQDRLRKDR